MLNVILFITSLTLLIIAASILLREVNKKD